MKYFIIDCNGMAGHMISAYLHENGNDVTGFARKDLGHLKTICGDVRNEKLLKEIIVSENYDIIVNCVGILNKSAEENKPEAVFVNGYLPHFLADVTKNIKTRIIHLSTNCVFSGEKKGGHTEHDLRDGTGFYARSKAIGELDDNKNLTIRSSIVGPDLNPEGIGLLNWFMMQKGTVNGYSNVIWNGQTSLQYAKTVEFAAKSGICGIYNAVPGSTISKCDLLGLFNKYFKDNSINIVPCDSPMSDMSLVNTRKDIDYCIPDYEKMVAESAKWMSAHKQMYPHYYKNQDMSKF